MFLLVIISLITFSCGKDDDGGATGPVVTTIEATGTSFEDGSARTSDLNGASSAGDVATNATITATFDSAIDAASATSVNAKISSAAGDVASAVSAAGSTVTINPDADLERGTMYTLTLSGIAAADGGILATTTRSFTTEGRAPVVVPNASEVIAYWSFDGTTDDATGTYNPNNEVAIEFTDDRFGQGGSAISFNGDDSVIEIPAAETMLDSDDFTVAFWMKTDSDGHVNENGDPAGHFVMGLGAFFGFQFEVPADYGFVKMASSYIVEDGTKVSEDLFFNGDGLDGTNGAWQGWDFTADLTGTGGVEALVKDKWVHIVCTYNAAEKQGQMFINGDLMKSQDFDLWPDGDVKRTVTGVTYQGAAADVEPILALGFVKSIDSPIWAMEPWGNYFVPTSNHFKGALDEVRIFKAPFSANDVKDLYDAEKP